MLAFGDGDVLGESPYPPGLPYICPPLVCSEASVGEWTGDDIGELCALDGDMRPSSAPYGESWESK